MTTDHPRPARLRRLATLALTAALVSLGGCASHYVDGNTRDIDSSQYKAPAAKRPVQMLFEFQSKGVANARATGALKPKIQAQVESSGLFAGVSDAPAADGALLTITLNNVPLSDDAFSKGFVTGLTFGLAGSQVSDGYVCTARYTAGNGAAPVTHQARHAIHTTVGATSAPGNAVKADGIESAVFTMTRQILSNVLNDLSQDPAFQAPNRP